MFVSLVASVALAQGAPLFVQADLLNLRQGPDASTTASGVLRIGTAVDVLSEDGSWLKVSLPSRPADHPVEGWVDGRFLDTVAPTTHELSARTQQALDWGEDDEALLWSTRARALAPHDVALQSQHQRILASTESRHGAAETEGPSEVLIAACEEDRVELLGSIDARGHFTRHDGDPDFEVGQLSTHHWMRWRAGQSSAEPIVGSPFVRPFHTASHNERDRSAYEPGTCTDLCDDVPLPVLGPCETDGAVFTSGALPRSHSHEAVATNDLRRDLERSLQASEGEGTEPRAVLTYFGDQGAVIRGSYGKEWGSYEQVVVLQGDSKTSFRFYTSRDASGDAVQWPEPPAMRPGVWLTSPDQSAQIGIFMTESFRGAQYQVLTTSSEGTQGTSFTTQGAGC